MTFIEAIMERGTNPNGKHTRLDFLGTSSPEHLLERDVRRTLFSEKSRPVLAALERSAPEPKADQLG
jgi:hypothetical protein